MVQFKKALTVFSFSLAFALSAEGVQEGKLGDYPELLAQYEEKVLDSLSAMADKIIISAWMSLSKNNVEAFNNFLGGSLKDELADKDKFETFKDSMGLDAADGPWNSAVVGVELLKGEEDKQNLSMLVLIEYLPENDPAKRVMYRIVLQGPITAKEGEVIKDDFAAMNRTEVKNLKIVQIESSKKAAKLSPLEESIMKEAGVSGLENIPTLQIDPESLEEPQQKPSSKKPMNGARYDQA